MTKPVGAVTRNKCITWRVKLRINDGFIIKNYRDLKSLSQDLGIHRSIVYRIYNNKQSTTRNKKNIVSIDKLRTY
jgi:hypothetical protein